MTYEKVDELVERRLQPLACGISKIKKGQETVISRLSQINGTIEAHNKDIDEMKGKLDEELKAAVNCPVRSGKVDVVVVEKETRWSRWLGKNRSFIFIIVIIVALLSGFPNWMRFFGVSMPQDPPPIIIKYEEPDVPRAETH